MIARPATMWTYPWDVVEGEPNATARFLKNELGMHGVRIAFVYHSFLELRPRFPEHHLVSSLDAHVYFEPTNELYGMAGITPSPSPLLKASPDMARVAAEACKNEGLAVIAWTAPLHASRLTVDYPEIRAVNAFGQAVDFSICPAHPRVLRYLYALGQDIAKEPTVDAIDVETPCWNEPFHAAHPKVGVEMCAADEALVGICFCEHCLQEAARAGVDGELLENAVKSHLLRVLRNGRSAPGTTFSTLCEQIPRLADYQTVRRSIVNRAIAELRRGSGLPVNVIDPGMGPVTAMEKLEETLSFAAGLVVLAYSTEEEEIRERVDYARAVISRLPAPIPLTIGLSLAGRENPSRETMARNVRAALEAGADGLAFYNYGMASEKVLDWLKTILR